MHIPTEAEQHLPLIFPCGTRSIRVDFQLFEQNKIILLTGKETTSTQR